MSDAIEGIRGQTSFSLIEGEEIIYETTIASHIKSLINVSNGKAILTKHRLVFFNTSMLTPIVVATGGLGGLAYMAYKGNKIGFQVVFRDLESVKKIKHGFTHCHLFKLADGREYKLQVRNDMIENIIKLGVTIT